MVKKVRAGMLRRLATMMLSLNPGPTFGGIRVGQILRTMTALALSMYTTIRMTVLHAHWMC